MLPIESFADVVSFLEYYDLDGLKLTNKLTSSIASRCADAIRLFDFSDFAFYIDDSGINVFRLGADGSEHWVCRLELPCEAALAVFIFEALRNCTFGRFLLATRRKFVLHATSVIAHTVTVADSLYIYVEDLGSTSELIEYVDSFRRVQSLKVWQSYRLTVDEKESLKNFCRRKGVGLQLHL